MQPLSSGKRIAYIDITKAFAIFTVVLGHVLQWTTAGDPYHRSAPFIFIYSFHMPLFMLLSGYFIGKSFSLPLSAFVKKRSVQLLLPVLAYSTMFVGFYDFIYARLVGTDSINFFTYLSSGWMWFLKYLFVCSLAAYISRKIFKNDILAAVIPTIMLILLTRSTIFRLLPFLWIGYFMNKHSEKLFVNVRALIASSAILFIGFLCFWKGDYDVALRIVSLKNGIDFNLTNFLIFIERFGVGLCGSIFFISVIKIVTERYSKSWFIAFCEKLGRNTLGIYCLQIYVLEFGLGHIDLKFYTPFSIVIQIALALGVLLTCHFITELLKRNKYTLLLFLGQKKSVRP